MTSIFIISAPSGSGKSTLVGKVRESVPGLDFSISYTTRKPRGNEQNGCEYFFISQAEFQEMILQDEFLEYAQPFHNGDQYGTARRFLREAQQRGTDLLLDINVEGAQKIRQKVPAAISIFILPPNRSELEKRLRNRSLDSEEVIQRRLVTASREIENYSKYDYILVNDRVEDSVAALRAILLAERAQHSGAQPIAENAGTIALAESCRLRNMRERLQPILNSFVTAAAPGGR